MTALPPKTLTKRELVSDIAHRTGLPHLEVQSVVQATLDGILDALLNGGKVEFRDFGVFSVRVRKARIGRNPKQPLKTVRIPPTPVMRFKPGRNVREALLARATRGRRQGRQ